MCYNINTKIIRSLFMETKIIDLYDYYKIAKPEGARGILTTYVHYMSREISLTRKLPAMLVIPGGAYWMVSDREAEPVALKFFAEGFNAFVLNYSVAGDSAVKYPYQLIEAEMAVAYIRQNAEELHVDPDQIAAVGFSAGGHLCAMLGSCDNCPDTGDIFKPQVSVKPNAVILSYPVITRDDKVGHVDSFKNLCGAENIELQNKVDILNLINEKSAPAFIWSTFTDNAVPCDNALLAALKYRESGVPVSVHVFGKGEHGLSVADMTVYGDRHAVDSMSVSVPEWVRLSVEWLSHK